jgi:hypothetical protein
MAQALQRDQAQRKVLVKRELLVEALEHNKMAHKDEYEQALAGYKQALLDKLHEAIKAAKVRLKVREGELEKLITNLTDKDIEQQPEYFPLLEAVHVQMPVPKSHADEYDAAIDMFTWDTRPELELTYAEFMCFVRDKWDWSADFNTISAFYNGPKGLA